MTNIFEIYKEEIYEDGKLRFSGYAASGMGLDSDDDIQTFVRTLTDWHKHTTKFNDCVEYTNMAGTRIHMNDSFSRKGEPRRITLERGLTTEELGQLALELSKTKVPKRRGW